MNATATTVSFDHLTEDKNLLKYVMLWLKRVYPKAGNTFPTLKRVDSKTYVVKFREESVGVIRQSNFNVMLTNGEYHGKIVVSTKTTPWGIMVRGVKAAMQVVVAKKVVTKTTKQKLDSILYKVAGGIFSIIMILHYVTN